MKKRAFLIYITLLAPLYAQSNERTLILASPEGNYYPIPASSIHFSILLGDLLDPNRIEKAEPNGPVINLAEDKTLITLSLPASTVRTVALALHTLTQIEDEKIIGQQRYETLIQKIPTIKDLNKAEKIELIKSAHYLGITPLEHALTRELARSLATMKSDMIIKEWKEITHTLDIQQLQRMIARHYIIETRKPLQPAAHLAYTLSLENLFKEGYMHPHDLGPQNNTIDITGLELTTLAGINQIPQADTVLKLDASHNNLTTLDDPELFRPFKALKQIDLSYNKIRSINKDLFDPLAQLQEISLQNNQIITFDTHQFEGPRSLLSVDLSCNAIVHLPRNFIARIKPNLTYFNFRNNPLSKETAEGIIHAQKQNEALDGLKAVVSREIPP